MNDKKIMKAFNDLIDTGKSRLFKKYNMSLMDICCLRDILKGEYKTFINGNVYKLLSDLGYPVIEYEIGFKYLGDCLLQNADICNLSFILIRNGGDND